MSSGITLTAAVRQNLLSLQDTASLLGTTQSRLSTGKKVNSALDNPINFFTSSGLTNRAGDLNALLDLIGQATQALSAADTGLTSLTKLVQSAKSIAIQAQQATAPTATYSTAITGNTAIAADTSRSVSTATYASVSGGLTASAKSTFTVDTSGGVGADGGTLTINDNNGHSATFENDATGDGVVAGHFGYADEAGLLSAIQSVFGSGNVSGTPGTNIIITGTDYTHSFAASAGTLSAQGSTTAAADGDKLTISQGSTTDTFRYVASGASTGAGTFTTLADLNAAINASTVGNSGGPTLASTVLASDDGTGHLKLETLGTSSFSVGGSLATALSNTGTYNANYNSTLTGVTGTLTVAVGTGAAQTITFGAGNVTTKAALTTALAGLTGSPRRSTARTRSSITSSTSDDVTIGGTGTGASSLFNNSNIGVNAPTVSAGTSSTVRSGLQTQFNDLLTQIDQLADDASYNGINLLNGDDLKVVFNENGTSVADHQRA